MGTDLVSVLCEVQFAGAAMNSALLNFSMEIQLNIVKETFLTEVVCMKGENSWKNLFVWKDDLVYGALLLWQSL